MPDRPRAHDCLPTTSLYVHADQIHVRFFTCSIHAAYVGQVDLGPPLGRVRVRSVAREHRHTLAHTGLMLWEAAPALARLLLAWPTLCEGTAQLR